MSETEYTIEEIKDVINHLHVCSDDILRYMYKYKYKLNARYKSIILNDLSQLYESISSLANLIDNFEDQI